MYIFRLWNAKLDPGISLQRNTHVNTLRYTDGSVIIQKTEDQLQKAIFTLNNILRYYWLKISPPKSQTMSFKGKHPIRTKMVIDNQILNQSVVILIT